MFDQVTKYEFKGKTYEQEHGNPFDRGSADSWYHRARNPHKGGSGGRFGHKPDFNLTADEVAAYHAGYDYNEQFGGKKDYD
jgi:hypothetical protein